MSGFLNRIRAEDFDDGSNRRTLLEDIVYHVGRPDSKDIVVVPAGFVTDGGSVPRVLWSLVNPWGKASKAYILHDWLYYRQDRSRLVCDAILLEAMEVLGVNIVQRWLVYRGVRMGGWVAWKKHKKRIDKENSKA